MESSELIFMFKNQFEMSWGRDMVHYPAGRSHQKMVDCGHEGMDIGQQQYFGRLWLSYYAELVLTGPKARKYSPPYNTTTAV